jgi:signal transduction histidine kinase
MTSRRCARRVGRQVLAGFVGMLGSFTLAMLSTQLFAARIHKLADDIVSNAAPSVAQLAATRTELRHLEVTLDDVVERIIAGKQLEGDARQVARLRSQLEGRWHDYEALPVFPGEQALRPRAEADLVALRTLIDRAMHAPDARMAASMLDSSKLVTDRLDASINRLEEFNIDEDARLANDIKERWRRSVVASMVAISLVMIMTLLTAWAVVRLVRHTARTLEDRADEYEEFAGRVAHDLANPIAAARMAVELAHETSTRSAAVDQLLDRIAGTLRRASTLLQDLYHYAEAGSTAADVESRADVSEVVRDVVDQVRPVAARQDVELAIDGVAPGRVACRPGVLISIMTNLVENALKHMGTSAERRVTVHLRIVPDRVRVEVEDCGPGIEPDIVDHIFEPYVRGSTTKAGLGLGLATVKRLTEGHGGRVGVQSRLGIGSVFWFELPQADGVPPRRHGWSRGEKAASAEATFPQNRR